MTIYYMYIILYEYDKGTRIIYSANYFGKFFYIYAKYSYDYGKSLSDMVKKKSHIDFLSELNAQNSKITVLGTYKNFNLKIAVKCGQCGCEWSPTAGNLLCGHECDITPAHILSGRECPKYGRSRRGESQRLTIEKFLERIHRIDPNLVLREGGIYINNRTLIPLCCKVCGYEYEIPPHDALNSRGYPNCHRACTSFLEQFIYHSFARVLGKSKVTSREKTAIGLELDISL